MLWRSFKFLQKEAKRAGPAIIVLLGFALFFFLSDEGICVFRRFTGIPCFGCGLTRGFLSVFRLDFVAAFSYNLLAVPLFFALIFFAAVFIFKREFFFKLIRIKLPVWAYAAAGAAAFANWGVNIVRLSGS
ncbi:MAG: DUF2752 domain-containing protein [Oscillospiraceae bacterium]|nr:DUF2752 domain-containing protein [Oscillospiraceae bacterium]